MIKILFNLIMLELLTMEKEKVTFNIDKNVKKQVKVIASIKGITATELYNKWILEGIEKEEIDVSSLLSE